MTVLLRRKLGRLVGPGLVTTALGAGLGALDVLLHTHAESSLLWTSLPALGAVALGVAATADEGGTDLFERLPVSPARAYGAAAGAALIWTLAMLIPVVGPRLMGWVSDPYSMISAINVLQTGHSFGWIVASVGAAWSLAGLGLGLLAGALAHPEARFARPLAALIAGLLAPFGALVACDHRGVSPQVTDAAPLTALLGLLLAGAGLLARSRVLARARRRRASVAAEIAFWMGTLLVGIVAVDVACRRWQVLDMDGEDVRIEWPSFEREANRVWMIVAGSRSGRHVVRIDLDTGASLVLPPEFDMDARSGGAPPVLDERASGLVGESWIVRPAEDGTTRRLVPSRGAAPEPPREDIQRGEWQWRLDGRFLAFVESTDPVRSAENRAWAVVADRDGQVLWRTRCDASRRVPAAEWLADGRLRVIVSMSGPRSPLEAPFWSVELFDPVLNESRSVRWPGDSITHDATGELHLVARTREAEDEISQSLVLANALDGSELTILPDSEFPRTHVTPAMRAEAARTGRRPDRLQLAARWHGRNSPPAVAVNDAFTRGAALLVRPVGDALVARLIALDLRAGTRREVDVTPPLQPGALAGRRAAGLPQLVRVTSDGQEAIVSAPSGLLLVSLISGKSTVLAPLRAGQSVDLELSPSGRRVRVASGGENVQWLDEDRLLAWRDDPLVSLETVGRPTHRLFPP